MLYTSKIPNLHESLLQSMEKGIDHLQSHQQALVFFRADDIGVPSKQLQLLLQLFSNYKTPLCLATVPTWLTSQRLDAISNFIDIHSSQWCWHQHGWLHKNYEIVGKKQEFGSARNAKGLQLDLEQGQLRLQNLLKESYFPFFTPPWNRCSEITINLLKHLMYLGISRSRNAEPQCPPDFPDIPINVDLHTRKESTPQLQFENLLKELSNAIAMGTAGIMIHHQRMNNEAFRFLEILLQLIQNSPKLTTTHFRDMIRGLDNIHSKNNK